MHQMGSWACWGFAAGNAGAWNGDLSLFPFPADPMPPERRYFLTPDNEGLDTMNNVVRDM